MKLSQNSTKTAIAAIFFSVLIFGAGFYYGNINEQKNGNNAASAMLPQPASAEDIDLGLFWKAWDTLNEKFVSRTSTTTSGISTTDRERVYGAIQGMTDSLDDPYTVFLPPTENEVFSGDIKGEFGGVGMEIGKRDSILTVIAPLKDSPAEKAGVKTGDIIVRINGNSTEGVSVQEAVQKIRGEKGTEVKLTLLSEKDNTTHEVSIERGTIQLPTIDTSQPDDETFVVALYNFSAQSPRLFREALEEFNDSGAQRLVVDLRGNAGGYLQAAVEVSSYFLEEGEVVVREDFGDREEAQTYRSKGYNLIDDDTEVAVLVNGGSASASEIVAGALRDNGVAQLVGTQTFGKGSVQELVQLSEDTALKVTVARWLTPNGTSISEKGLAPDVEIEAEEGEADVQLDRAVEVLRGN